MILIDTGPLVALCDPSDQFHKSAVADLKTLAREQFAVCVPVLTEAFFHVRGFRRERFVDLLTQMAAQSIALDDSKGWSALFDWIERYADHDPDLADGYLAVLCGADRRLKVWTYDREFYTTWRRPDGTAIPLAVPAG